MKSNFKIDEHTFQIDVDVKSRNGSVGTNLKATEPQNVQDVAWNFGVDVFESFILALLCAGYKMDKRMREVLDTVMDAMSNHADEIDFSMVLPEMLQFEPNDVPKELDRLRRELEAANSRCALAVQNKEDTERRTKDVLAYNQELLRRLKLVKEVTNELIGRVTE
jgi:hypothetical protein